MERDGNLKTRCFIVVLFNTFRIIKFVNQSRLRSRNLLDRGGQNVYRELNVKELFQNFKTAMPICNRSLEIVMSQ